MAKRRRKKTTSKRRRRRRNPGNPTRRRRTYRRRNPTMKEVKGLLPMAGGAALGMIGSRTLVNVVMPRASGYIRAALQVATAVVISSLLDRVMKEKAIPAGFLVGGLAVAVLQLLDTVTGGRYSLADENGIMYIPETTEEFLPTMTDMGRYEMEGLGQVYEYEKPSDVGRYEIGDVGQTLVEWSVPAIAASPFAA